jgi:hypothetical protein
MDQSGGSAQLPISAPSLSRGTKRPASPSASSSSSASSSGHDLGPDGFGAESAAEYPGWGVEDEQEMPPRMDKVKERLGPLTYQGVIESMRYIVKQLVDCAGRAALENVIGSGAIITSDYSGIGSAEVSVALIKDPAALCMRCAAFNVSLVSIRDVIAVGSQARSGGRFGRYVLHGCSCMARALRSMGGCRPRRRWSTGSCWTTRRKPMTSLPSGALAMKTPLAASSCSATLRTPRLST